MAGHGSSPRRVFVTGGTGCIGSDPVDRLPARECRVTAYDDLSTGQRVFQEQASANVLEAMRPTGYEVTQRFYEVGSVDASVRPSSACWLERPHDRRWR